MISKHEKATLMNWVEQVEIDRLLILKARRKVQKNIDNLNSAIARQATRLQKLETFIENS